MKAIEAEHEAIIESTSNPSGARDLPLQLADGSESRASIFVIAGADVSIVGALQKLIDAISQEELDVLPNEPGESAPRRSIHGSNTGPLGTIGPVRYQSACAPPRRLAAYGNTNKYRPVIIWKANGTTASSPIQRAYLPASTSTKLKMIAAVIAMDSQR